MEPKKFIITEDIIKAIIAYLSTRPYQEVVKGIELLTNLPELKQSTTE